MWLVFYKYELDSKTAIEVSSCLKQNEDYVIGRSKKSPFFIKNDKSISRQHVTLKWKNDNALSLINQGKLTIYNSKILKSAEVLQFEANDNTTIEISLGQKPVKLYLKWKPYVWNIPVEYCQFEKKLSEYGINVTIGPSDIKPAFVVNLDALSTNSYVSGNTFFALQKGSTLLKHSFLSSFCELLHKDEVNFKQKYTDLLKQSTIQEYGSIDQNCIQEQLRDTEVFVFDSKSTDLTYFSFVMKCLNVPLKIMENKVQIEQELNHKKTENNILLLSTSGKSQLNEKFRFFGFRDLLDAIVSNEVASIVQKIPLKNMKTSSIIENKQSNIEKLSSMNNLSGDDTDSFDELQQAEHPKVSHSSDKIAKTRKSSLDLKKTDDHTTSHPLAQSSNKTLDKEVLDSRSPDKMKNNESKDIVDPNPVKRRRLNRKKVQPLDTLQFFAGGIKTTQSDKQIVSIASNSPATSEKTAASNNGLVSSIPSTTNDKIEVSENTPIPKSIPQQEEKKRPTLDLIDNTAPTKRQKVLTPSLNEKSVSNITKTFENQTFNDASSPKSQLSSNPHDSSRHNGSVSSRTKENIKSRNTIINDSITVISKPNNDDKKLRSSDKKKSNDDGGFLDIGNIQSDNEEEGSTRERSSSRLLDVIQDAKVQENSRLQSKYVTVEVDELTADAINKLSNLVIVELNNDLIRPERTQERKSKQKNKNDSQIFHPEWEGRKNFKTFNKRIPNYRKIRGDSQSQYMGSALESGYLLDRNYIEMKTYQKPGYNEFEGNEFGSVRRSQLPTMEEQSIIPNDEAPISMEERISTKDTGNQLFVMDEDFSQNDVLNNNDGEDFMRSEIINEHEDMVIDVLRMTTSKNDRTSSSLDDQKAKTHKKNTRNTSFMDFEDVSDGSDDEPRFQFTRNRG